MSYSSIVDVPKKASETDLFGIDKYKNGLIKFIKNSDTPLTIAIQGEWGSGKTSLLNSLQEVLCGEYATPDELKNHNHEFYGIWINTWQYSLMRSQEETLISIVSGISNKILEIINARHKSGAEKLGKSILNFGSRIFKSTAAFAAEKVIGEGAASVVDNVLEKESSNQTIKSLRDDLQESIFECLQHDAKMNLPKKGFIFFIDDLDRVDPSVAVQILELLKNIFDLHHCIFILAIDYDVVVKGLKPKFGELTEKNEREFRSFFDKIIQMPFSMPVTNYVIDKFLVENLIRIGYINQKQGDQTELAEKFSMICNLSVGTNPRSLKRLMNTISLITIINNEMDEGNAESKDSDYLLINFGLICIQIAYPQIYKCLSLEGDFKKWNEAFATKLKLRVLAPHEIEKLNKSEEFDEEWEQIVFRICEKDTYLSNRASQISQLLNLTASCIKDGSNLGEVIEEMMELSAVTDVQAFDKPKQAVNRGPVLKDFSARILPLLKAKLPSPFPMVRQQSKKVQSNLYIAYSKQSEGWKNWVGFTISSHKDNLSLIIWIHPWLFATKSKLMRQDLKDSGCLEKFEIIAKKYDDLMPQYPSFIMKYPGISSSGIAKEKWHVPHITFHFPFAAPSELLEVKNLQEISNFTTEIVKLYGELLPLADQHNSAFGVKTELAL